jgi:hypothetical protein
MSEQKWQCLIEVTGSDALSALLKDGQFRVVGDIINTSSTSTSTSGTSNNTGHDTGPVGHAATKTSPAKRGDPLAPFPFRSKNAGTAKQKQTIVESIKKGKVEIGQMRADFKKAGFPNGQFDVILQSLRAGKYVQSTGRGRYKLTAAGLNGAAAH